VSRPAARPAATPAESAPAAEELPVRKKARQSVAQAERQLAADDPEGARALAEQALKLDSTFARGHRARAVACSRTGDVECARKAYEEYLQLAPDAPDAPDVRRILGL
jgi:Tfp pilus assembly protein PilF